MAYNFVSQQQMKEVVKLMMNLMLMMIMTMQMMIIIVHTIISMSGVQLCQSTADERGDDHIELDDHDNEDDAYEFVHNHIDDDEEEEQEQEGGQDDDADKNMKRYIF